MTWRDTDPRNVCACGRRKSPESARCQPCHLKRVHKRKKARGLVEKYLGGATLYLGPGEAMDAEEFGPAIREVVTELT